jgi:hypothetical protein
MAGAKLTRRKHGGFFSAVARALLSFPFGKAISLVECFCACLTAIATVECGWYGTVLVS